MGVLAGRSGWLIEVREGAPGKDWPVFVWCPSPPRVSAQDSETPHRIAGKAATEEEGENPPRGQNQQPEISFVDVYYAYNFKRPADHANFTGTGTTAKRDNEFAINSPRWTSSSPRSRWESTSQRVMAIPWR
jgi:hypothetical protein